MQRRDFLKSGVALAVAAELGTKKAQGIVPTHNWGKYDFGSGPTVTDRLNQGPFSQYPPDASIPTDDVVMTTTPSEEVVPNYGKGLITYITADMGTEEIKSDNIPQAIEDLVRFPLGQQLYIRPTWREIQPRAGRLELPDYLKLVFDLAKKNSKRIGMRVQMNAPDYVHQPALPDFVLEKVPTVELIPDPKEASAAARFVQNPYARYQPRYDHPFFQQSFRELIGLLAAEFNGSPAIEFIDTFMYGFWGEGHTWPFINTPFPDYQTAERTWINMLEVQLEHFTKTPLMTNTQPDYSRVGNSEILDRTVRSNNWIRSDTIFIENEQIEALSNRPPWIAAVLEQGLPGKAPDALAGQEGVSASDNMIAHVMDVGANYRSLWNFHQISAKNLMSYYQASPTWFDQINLRHVHVRRAACGLRGPALIVRPRRAGDLPVLVHVVSQRARVLRLRRTEQPLASSAAAVLPSSYSEWSRHPDLRAFRSSIAPPTDASIYASRNTSRCSRQDSRSGWIRYFLSCRALASPTTCRFIPAHSGLPVTRPELENGYDITYELRQCRV